MSVATLDTHEVVKDLLSAGFTDEQAKAVARNLRKAQDLDFSALATKLDVEKLRGDLHGEIEKLCGDLRGDIEEVRGEIGQTKAEMIKWMFGTMGVQTIILLGALVTLIKLVKP